MFVSTLNNDSTSGSGKHYKLNNNITVDGHLDQVGGSLVNKQGLAVIVSSFKGTFNCGDFVMLA